MSSWYLNSYFSDVACAKFEEGLQNECLPLALAYVESMASVIFMVIGGTPTVNAEPFYEVSIVAQLCNISFEKGKLTLYLYAI